MTPPVYSHETHALFLIKAADLFQLSKENQTAIMNKINFGYARNHAKFNTMEGEELKIWRTLQVMLDLKVT